jgi:uncharacterized Rmd1/YagE family protein
MDPNNRQLLNPLMSRFTDARQKDKFVALPIDKSDDAVERSELSDKHLGLGRIGKGANKKGRITLYCLGESFDRGHIEEILLRVYSPEVILTYPDCFYVNCLHNISDDKDPIALLKRAFDTAEKGENNSGLEEMFFFDYGIAALWGMTMEKEAQVIHQITSQIRDCFEPSEIHVDEFHYNFTATEKPHVQNDTGNALKSAPLVHLVHGL